VDDESPARYLPGTGTLLGQAHRWLLLGRPLEAQVVAQLWSQLDAPLDAVATLTRHLGSGAAFAVVDTETGDQIVHGPVAVATAGEGLLVTLAAVTGEPTVPVVGGAVSAGAVHLPVVRRRRLLIEGVPEAILASEPGAPPTEPRGLPLASLAAAGDHTATRPGTHDGAPAAAGMTMGGATRVRPQPTGAHPLQQSTGETVLAARCVNSHLTPPEQPTCRSCGAEVPPQTPLRVPRPPLGQLMLPDGVRVLLDRSVVLGRRPEAIPGGETWPHLVELPADRTHLSRQHLLVELDEWRILARDLGSRSGSALRAATGEAQRMLPHQTYVVSPGSVLVLADDFPIRVVVELSGDSA